MEAPLAPTLRGYHFVSALWILARDRLGAMLELPRRHGDVLRMPLPGNSFYLVGGNEGAKRVLHENSKNYRRSFDHETLKLLLGESILTTHDETWRFFRKLSQPTFHRQFLQQYVRQMNDSTLEAFKRWRSAPGGEITLSKETARLTVEITSMCIFNHDLGEDAVRIEQAFIDCQKHLALRAFSPIDVAKYLRTPGRRRFERAVAVLDSIVYPIISARRLALAGGTAPEDLLSDFIQTPDPATGAPLTDRTIRDQMLTILIAGFETTAMVVFWTLYLLSIHPAWKARLRAESQAVLTGDRSPTLADLSLLPQHRMVLEESMRLYPPVWSIGREAINDDIIQGKRIKAGTTVLVSPYSLHRRPEYWDAAKQFLPERFAAGSEAFRQKTIYIPFGAGARQCIGSEFALLELQLMLPLILKHFEFELAPGQQVIPDALISLRPRGNVRLRLTATQA